MANHSVAGARLVLARLRRRPKIKCDVGARLALARFASWLTKIKGMRGQASHLQRVRCTAASDSAGELLSVRHGAKRIDDLQGRSWRSARRVGVRQRRAAGPLAECTTMRHPASNRQAPTWTRFDPHSEGRVLCGLALDYGRANPRAHAPGDRAPWCVATAAGSVGPQALREVSNIV